jgi:hypothetical protein
MTVIYVARAIVVVGAFAACIYLISVLGGTDD